MSRPWLRCSSAALTLRARNPREGGDETADDSPVLAPKVDVWEKEDW